MIRAVEWKRLFSALKIHFFERFSWLTCVDIFFASGVCGKQCLFDPSVFVDFSIALEACDIVCLIDMRYVYNIYEKKSNSKYFREKFKSLRQKP